MTLQTTTASVSYIGNGAATNFPVPFKFLDSDHLIVTRIVIATNVETVVPAIDYTVNGVGVETGGSIDYLFSGSPLPSTHSLRIERIVPYTQDLDIDNEGGFLPETVEQQLDLIVMQIQQLYDLTGDFVDSSTWLSGAGVPSVSLGSTGDMYLDTSTSDVYGPKTTIWGSVVVNIKGATGAAGSMTGPGSSVDNRVVLFNGTSGSVVKDSGVLISALALLAANTYTGKQTYPAGATGASSLNIPAGVAPTTPGNGDVWSTAADLFMRLSGVTETFAFLSANTFTGKQITLASASGGAGFNLPHGVAPSAPTNGDLWTTSASIFVRINGVTVDLTAVAAAAATQAEQEAASSNTVFTTPGRAHFHPSAAKMWGFTDGTTAPVLQTSYNVTSIADNGGGVITVTIATDFSSALWALFCTPYMSATSLKLFVTPDAITAGTFILRTYSDAGVATDPTGFSFSGYGDQ